LSFSDKAAALAKARHIASTVGDHLHHALTTASSSPHPTPSITTTEWDEQLAVHGKTVRDAVVHYLHQLVARSDGGHSVSEAALRWADYVRTDTKKRNRPQTIQERRAAAIREPIRALENEPKLRDQPRRASVIPSLDAF